MKRGTVVLTLGTVFLRAMIRLEGGLALLDRRPGVRRRLLPLLAVTLLVTSCGDTGTEPEREGEAEAVASILNLEYGGTSGLHQRLDLYLPDGPGPFPVVVFVHGGGFSAGDKSDINRLQWRPLLERGFAFASVNYRLSDEALFPAPIQDVKGAIAFLRRNGEQLGLDTTRVGAWGPSSGAMLVGLLALSEEEPTLRGPLHLGYGSGVDAAVLWSPVTDLLNLVSQMVEQGCATDWVPGQISSFLDPATLDTMAWASPITYVSSDDPPILMQHGTADCNVPPAQSETLGDALIGAGAPGVTVELIPGAGHGIPGLSGQVDTVIDFFVRTLG